MGVKIAWWLTPVNRSSAAIRRAVKDRALVLSDPTDYQRVLFVADSFQELAERASEWLAALTTSR
jgi:hypothetical protein